ncbi:MAG: hypothetical protein KatS3mg104_2872 [Phycisphaerae bacterium]|nr:MAG: hypothetical protein KatS3mg104_2872 [Phycisphaerae bacterium]
MWAVELTGKKLGQPFDNSDDNSNQIWIHDNSIGHQIASIRLTASNNPMPMRPSQRA